MMFTKPNLLHKLARISEELKYFDWAELRDPDTIGDWPASVKAVVLSLIFAVSVAAGYLLLAEPRYRQLQAATSAEQGLRLALEQKTAVATGIGRHRRQASEAGASFARLLRLLPSETEVPGLIDDITATGEGSGLEFTAITPARENTEGLYIESPIQIEAIGGYHNIGAFVSGVAGLHRIVTLHDFTMVGRDDGRLELSVTAHTYRYGADAEALIGDDGSIGDAIGSAEAKALIGGDGNIGDAASDIEAKQRNGQENTALVMNAEEASGGNRVEGGNGVTSPQVSPPHTVFTYTAAARRSPFSLPLAVRPAAAPSSQREVTPDLTRPRSPLESRPLSELTLVGWIHRGNVYEALLKDQSDIVHRVRAGDYLGPNHGRIVRITDTEVSLLEIVPDGTGWIERPQVLTLRTAEQ